MSTSLERRIPPPLAAAGGDLAALLAGASLVFAYAPFGLGLLAVPALALLFLLWWLVPERALRRGYAFGLGQFGAGVSWVFVSIYGYGGVNLPLSLFLTALFVAFLALFPAAAGALAGRFGRRRGAAPALALVFPACWVLLEWCRGWFLTGFPWLLMGYSQLDLPLAGWAPVLGVYGVSLTVALSAGLLAAAVLAPSWRDRTWPVVAVAVLWLAGALMAGVSWTQPHGRPLKVSLLQGNIPQELKWTFELRQPTLDLYAGLTRANWDADLIVWPETALPDFYHREQDFLDGLEAEARRHGSSLLVGVLYQEPGSRRYFNSMVSLDGGRAFYHKNHLVPFTEYLPLKGALAGIVDFMNVPMSDFSAGGPDQSPLPAAGQQAGISICYEDAFGEEVIRMLPQATVLVNVSNDAWFGESVAPFQHLQMARMRALESGRPMLRATNTGLTAVIDARGAVQSQAPQFKVYALNDEVQPMRGMTPYARSGNSVAVGAAVLMWLAGLWPGGGRKR
ncbi:MAG TPA: apolipoprotein N-acyltransferase [Gammaproteobacteria bacterium]|nr:apolipoprotein N-acyltransferase [Gammaproteobacteria bacterium]